MPIGQDVLEFIARKVVTNIRELEGALNRIVAYASMQGMPITVDLAQAVLSNVLYNRASAPSRRSASPRRSRSTTAWTWRRSRARSATGPSSVPRQIAMYLMRAETEVSLLRIGAELGGRDHSTVLHACDKIDREMQENEDLRRELAAVRELIYTE